MSLPLSEMEQEVSCTIKNVQEGVCVNRPCTISCIDCTIFVHNQKRARGCPREPTKTDRARFRASTARFSCILVAATKAFFPCQNHSHNVGMKCIHCSPSHTIATTTTRGRTTITCGDEKAIISLRPASQHHSQHVDLGSNHDHLERHSFPFAPLAHYSHYRDSRSDHDFLMR